MSFTRTAEERRRRRCQREISAGRVSPRSPPRRARVRRANLGSPRRARGPVVRPAMRGARDRRARSRRPPRRALCGTREGSRDVLSEPQLLFVFGQRKKRRTTVRGSSPKIITAKSDSCRVPRDAETRHRWMSGVREKAPAVASAPWRSLGACDARGTPGRRSGRRGKPYRKTTTTTRPPRAATGAPLSARRAPRPRRPHLVSGRSWHW